MKTQTIVILCVGAALGLSCLIIGGLVASYLTSQLIAQKNAKMMILVAKHNYPKGTAINNPEQMFEFREILQTDAPFGAISDLDFLKDRTLTDDIREGQTVVGTLLGDKIFLGPLEAGKRAMAVKTKARGGFIFPGARVDVIHNKTNGAQKSEGKLLLQNILVLAVDEEPPFEKKKMELVRLIVTLEVTPEEALVLVPFTGTGNFTLIRRGPGDEQKMEVDKSTKKP